VRLLLDEHFSPEIARQLRSRGHDVVAARERADVHGLADSELLALATVERRAVVTENVADFVELHRTSVVTRQPHHGIIFTSPRQFPRTRRAIGRMVRALDGLLGAHPLDDALTDQTWWLEPASR
jgi:predicted nuclease of predicted toxin-antitoxin system